MVELFTPAGFSGSARSGSPVPLVAKLEAPHASQVERTDRLEPPWTGFAPALNTTALALEQQPGDVRIAPARNVSDRMPGLLGRIMRPDYSGKPPSNWASTSRCDPALRNDLATGG
jgi:hypothetical protein